MLRTAWQFKDWIFLDCYGLDYRKSIQHNISAIDSPASGFCHKYKQIRSSISLCI